jgi:predicted outer membrane repeat protein
MLLLLVLLLLLPLFPLRLVDILEIENLHVSNCADTPLVIYGANEFHLRHCTVSNNTATASGGMYGEFSGPMFFEDVTFANNTAETEGGGLYLWSVDELTMTDCVIHGNVVSSMNVFIQSYYGLQ